MHNQTHTSTMSKPSNKTTVNTMYPLLVTLAAVCFVTAAHATLGGDGASIEVDRLSMKVKHAARLTPSSSGSYTVHETILSSGTLVRQYVSNAGVVFGVAWNGPFVPDLRQLLGSHFDTMVARQSGQRHAGHKFVSQHNSDLVIESGGHPRSFVGRAYLPGAVPASVAVQEIQ